MRRVDLGVALPDFMKAFRIGQIQLWDGILDGVAHHPETKDAALTIVGQVMRTIEVGSTAAWSCMASNDAPTSWNAPRSVSSRVRPSTPRVKPVISATTSTGAPPACARSRSIRRAASVANRGPKAADGSRAAT